MLIEILLHTTPLISFFYFCFIEPLLNLKRLLYFLFERFFSIFVGFWKSNNFTWVKHGGIFKINRNTLDSEKWQMAMLYYGLLVRLGCARPPLSTIRRMIIETLNKSTIIPLSETIKLLLFWSPVECPLILSSITISKEFQIPTIPACRRRWLKNQLPLALPQ